MACRAARRRRWGLRGLARTFLNVAWGAETHKRTEYGGHRKEGIKTTNSLENIAYVRH
jgi:hypothetical protein